MANHPMLAFQDPPTTHAGFHPGGAAPHGPCESYPWSRKTPGDPAVGAALLRLERKLDALRDDVAALRKEVAALPKAPGPIVEPTTEEVAKYAPGERRTYIDLGAGDYEALEVKFIGEALYWDWPAIF
jgi:hypothetical protein